MERAASATIRKELIVDQLQKVLASETFTRSQRMSRFLRFTVEQSLEGRADRLKEYLIGVEVYDKPETLDPRFDPIVRVEAGRLRAKLREYYETDGREDVILISFPKRSYAPLFHWNDLTSNSGTAANPRELEARPPGQSTRSIAVLPFIDMSQKGELQHFCDGLTDEVNAALANVEGLRVVARSSMWQFKDRLLDVRQIGQELNTESLIEGSVRSHENRLRVTYQLNSCVDGYHIWCDVRESQLSDVWAFQCEISADIAERFRGSAQS
jgi:TolB-like protein